MEMNNNHYLAEEVFCLNFELKAITDLLIRGEAERWVPKMMWKEIEEDHLERYNLATQFVKNKTVLDIACGCGFGTYLLAQEGKATKVVGCDLDAEAIRYSNHRFRHENVERIVGNAENFSFPNKFDVIVSFETIEHLSNYESFLNSVSKSLNTGGLFIVSTPITLKTNRNCKNPYHKIEWNFDDFIELMKSYFLVEEIYLQSISFVKKPPTIFKKVWKRIFPQTLKKDSNFSKPIKFNGQIITSKIDEGYQLLICKKQ